MVGRVEILRCEIRGILFAIRKYASDSSVDFRASGRRCNRRSSEMSVQGVDRSIVSLVRYNPLLQWEAFRRCRRRSCS